MMFVTEEFAHDADIVISTVLVPHTDLLEITVLRSSSWPARANNRTRFITWKAPGNNETYAAKYWHVVF